MSSSIETRDFYPELERTSALTASGSKVVSYTIDHGSDKPIVMLIHGYPQSAFEWRTVSILEPRRLAPLTSDRSFPH